MKKVERVGFQVPSLVNSIPCSHDWAIENIRSGNKPTRMRQAINKIPVVAAKALAVAVGLCFII